MTFPTDLERLLKEATEGPWSVDPDHRPDMEWNNHITVDGKPWTICFMAHDPKDNSGQQAAAELIVLLRNHADAILGLVRAAERSMEHAAHKREADKEPDDLMRAGILGGMVISIEEELRPAMEALNRASDLSR